MRSTMARNIKRVSEVVKSLPGVSCQPVKGGAFAFPRVHLPPKAIQKAQVIMNHSKTLFFLFLFDTCQISGSFMLILGTGTGTRHVLLCETP